MWIKLTDKEILENEFLEEDKFKKSRLKKGLKFGLWTFIVIAVLFPIDYVLFGVPNGRYDRSPNKQIDWIDLPDYLHEIMGIAVFFSFAIFMVFFFWGRKVKSTTQMCDRCFKTRNFSQNMTCDCGGKYELLANYKWIDDVK
jgi:hypothetical protein